MEKNQQLETILYEKDKLLEQMKGLHDDICSAYIDCQHEIQDLKNNPEL